MFTSLRNAAWGHVVLAALCACFTFPGCGSSQDIAQETGQDTGPETNLDSAEQEPEVPNEKVLAAQERFRHLREKRRSGESSPHLSAPYPTTPSDVVKEFCGLDFEGALGTWAQRESYFEGEILGGDHIVVVESFQVGATKIQGDKATVAVTYENLGLFPAHKFIFKPETWSTEFSLVRIEGKWKITDPITVPHVSVHVEWERILGVPRVRGLGSRPEEAKQTEILRQLAALVPGFTLENGQPASPKDVVNEYCRLDFEGVEFDHFHPDRPKYFMLITLGEPWTRNPDKLTFVASNFEVTSVSRGETEATVEVTFKVLGRMDDSTFPPKFIEDRRDSVVKFRVVKLVNGWRIAPGIYPWHLSPSAMKNRFLRHFERYMERGKSAKMIAAYETLLQQLEALEE